MAENEEDKESVARPGREGPFVPFPGGAAAGQTFNPAALLYAIMENDGPFGVAESLDQAYTSLAEYIVSDPNTSGQHYAHVLYDLRRLRNALLQGGGWGQP